MKLTAIFLVSILAVVFGETIDLNLPGKTFLDGASNVGAPALEFNVPTDQLKGTIINAIGLYIDQIVNQLNNQAFSISNTLQGNVQRVSKVLSDATDSDGNSSPDSLNGTLNELNQILFDFLNLLPGNAKIKRKSLPDLPNEPSVVLPNENARTPNEIFLDLASVLDNDLSLLHDVINTVYIEGWRSARPSLYTLQDQFRDQLLNGDILTTYRNAVVAVNANANIIKPRVSVPVWVAFTIYGPAVTKIYDNLQSAKQH